MKRAFGFIDVQKDFMNSTGALYVPNAESIKEKIGKLVIFAHSLKCPVFYTQDQHLQTDPEMITVGGPFPIHCIRGTPGADNIDEAKSYDHMGNPLLWSEYFPKRCYNVFDEKLGNPDIKKWLKDNQITEVWLAGVATDYCVKAAALGLRKENIEVYVFENAIMGVAPETTEAAIKEMKDAGCHFVRCEL